ncbi:MAG: hypothetical protein EOO97_00370 [Pedobacter sp.]|nr:MAG: hypothetical protein EOO97_00370 [Pedobacter sp.]
MTKKKRAALICRVSTIDKQSNDRQVEELTALATSRGYLVEADDVYEDKISGFSKYEDRPALSRLLQNIRTKKKSYDMVFAMEVSRISRKPEEGQKILLQFSELGVPIHIKNINQCTHGEDGKRNPFFQIIYTLLQEFAHTEAQYTRERSISGIRSQMKKGGAGGGVFKAYGYTKDENKKLVIDETERGVVEDIFEYASKGYGISTITKILNDSGVPTKAQKVVAKGTIATRGSGMNKRVIKTDNLKWADGTVQSILTNPIYKGERQVKTDEQMVDGKLVPVYTTVKVPAIIEPELFDLVQKQRSEKYNQRSSDQRYMYILKNLCICGRCGRNMVGRFKPGPNGPTDAYYQCSSKRIGFENCGNHSVNIEAIESVVWNVVTHSPKVFEYFKSTGTQLQEANDKMSQLKVDVNFLEKSLADLEKEKASVKSLFRKGIYDESEFDVEWAKLVKKGDTLQQQMKRTRKQMTSLADLRVRLSNMDLYIETVEKMRMDRFQIAQVLNNVLSRVVVTSYEKNGIGINYVVSIYIKDMVPPITVLLLTKMRHRNFADPDFDMNDPKVLADTGQNRFIYIPGGSLGEEVIEYDSNGVLVSNIQNVVSYIQDRKVKKGEVVPSIHGKEHSVFERDTEWVWPPLVAFDDNNAIEQMKVLDKKRKGHED